MGLTVIALAVGLGIWLNLPSKLHLVHLLEQSISQEHLEGTFTLSLQDQEFAGSYYVDTVGTAPYLCLELMGQEIYVHQRVLSFSNGRGYDLSDYLPNLTGWQAAAVALTQWSSVSSETGTIHTLTLNHWGQAIIRSRLSLDVSQGSLTLTERDGTIQEATIQLDDWGEFHITWGPSEQSIPTEALMAIQGQSPLDLQVLNPLFQAGSALFHQSDWQAQAKMEVTCGPLPIWDEGTLFIQSDKLWFQRRDTLTQIAISGMDEPEVLLAGMALLLCRDGEMEQSSDGTFYTLTLDAADLLGMLEAMVPELHGLDLTLEPGVLCLELEEDSIRQVSLNVQGEIPFLLASLPLTFQLTVTPEPS